MNNKELYESIVAYLQSYITSINRLHNNQDYQVLIRQIEEDIVDLSEDYLIKKYKVKFYESLNTTTMNIMEQFEECTLHTKLYYDKQSNRVFSLVDYLIERLQVEEIEWNYDVVVLCQEEINDDKSRYILISDKLPMLLFVQGFEDIIDSIDYSLLKFSRQYYRPLFSIYVDQLIRFLDEEEENMIAKKEVDAIALVDYFDYQVQFINANKKSIDEFFNIFEENEEGGDN